MKLLLALVLAIPVIAQTPIPAPSTNVPGSIMDCKVSIQSSATMSKLYGKHLSLFVASMSCKNYSNNIVELGYADVDLGLPLNLINSSDGQAILTASFGKTKVQVIMKLINVVGTGIGLATGIGGPFALTARDIGYLLFGQNLATQGVDAFTAGSPTLASLTATLCSNVFGATGGTIILNTGGSVNCNILIGKPDKSAPPLLSTYNFSFDPTVAPQPSVSPQPGPVKLKPHVSGPIRITEVDKLPTYVDPPVAIASTVKQYRAQDYLLPENSDFHVTRLAHK